MDLTLFSHLVNGAFRQHERRHFLRACEILLRCNLSIIIELKQRIFETLVFFPKDNGQHDGQHNPPCAKENDKEHYSYDLFHKCISL